MKLKFFIPFIFLFGTSRVPPTRKIKMRCGNARNARANGHQRL